MLSFVFLPGGKREAAWAVCLFRVVETGTATGILEKQIPVSYLLLSGCKNCCCRRRGLGRRGDLRPSCLQCELPAFDHASASREPRVCMCGQSMMEGNEHALGPGLLKEPSCCSHTTVERQQREATFSAFTCVGVHDSTFV